MVAMSQIIASDRDPGQIGSRTSNNSEGRETTSQSSGGTEVRRTNIDSNNNDSTEVNRNFSNHR